MKKFLALLLALTTALSLVSCGGNATEKTEAEVKTESEEVKEEIKEEVKTEEVTEEIKEEVKTEEVTEEIKEETEEATPPAEETNETEQPVETPIVEVDKNLFSVELTIPAAYHGEESTQESLDELASERGFKSVTLNSDGSVTYVMTKDQHKALMEEMKASIDDSLAEMVTSETYPTFVEITANEDYTAFDVLMSTDTLGLSESFTILAFYVYGGMYNAFNGTEVDNISVSFINQATGEVIHTANSKDMQ